MITRKELLQSKEYWVAKFQTALYEQVKKYLKESKMSNTEFAAKLGVSKGYISQILNGDFDHKLSKFIELSLIIQKAPILKFVDIEECFVLDSLNLLDSLDETHFEINISNIYSKTIRIEEIATLKTHNNINKSYQNVLPFIMKPTKIDLKNTLYS